MDVMRRLMLSMALALLLGLQAIPCPAQERSVMDEEATLYPAPRQHGSYSLYYDITLASPGLLSIGVEILDTMPEKQDEQKFLTVSLLRRSREIELKSIDMGSNGGTFSYGVDAFELERTRGEYRIVISNWSRQHTATVKLVALYPGCQEREPEEVKTILIPGNQI